jgi:hypothetical protein
MTNMRDDWPGSTTSDNEALYLMNLKIPFSLFAIRNSQLFAIRYSLFAIRYSLFAIRNYVDYESDYESDHD